MFESWEASVVIVTRLPYRLPYHIRRYCDAQALVQGNWEMALISRLVFKDLAEDVYLHCSEILLRMKIHCSYSDEKKIQTFLPWGFTSRVFQKCFQLVTPRWSLTWLGPKFLKCSKKLNAVISYQLSFRNCCFYLFTKAGMTCECLVVARPCVEWVLYAGLFAPC